MKRFALALALFSLAGAARATEIPAEPPFQPAGHYIAVTATSAGEVATLPTGSPQIVIYNQGDVDAIVVLGPTLNLGSASPPPTPSLTGDVVRSHGWLELTLGSATQIAVITANGSAPLLISAGVGAAAAGGAPGVNASVFPSLNSDGGALAHVLNWPTATPDTAAGDLAAIHANTTGLATAAKQPALNGDGGAPNHVTNWPAATPDTASGDLAAIHANTTGLATAAKQPALNVDGGAPNHVTNWPAATPDTASGDLAAIHAATTGLATAAKQPALNVDGGAQVHVMNLPTTQPVSATSLPLPSGAATAANQPALNGDGGALVHLTNPPTTTPDTAAGDLAAIHANTNSEANNLGAPGATACTSDTGACNVNALLQRLAQDITGLKTAIGSPLQGGGGVAVTNFPATQTVAGNLGRTWSLSNSADTVTTTPANASAPVSNQSLVATGTAAAIGSGALVNGVVIKALSTNVGTVYVGGSGVTTTNGYPLSPGEAVSVQAPNLSAVFEIGANAADKFTYLGD